MSRDDTEAVGYPEELPAEAVPHWPDLSRWPTPDDVELFKRETRRRPAVRLAVLSGLRSWAEIDFSPVWSWTSAFLTVVLAGIGGTIAAKAQPIQLALGALLVLAAFGLLLKLMSMSTIADRRRRRARIWLRALEA